MDCAIRCGRGNWPGLQADLLFPQELAPLCRPTHPAAGRPVPETAPEDLIVNSRHPAEWRDSLSAFDIPAPDPARGHGLEGREFIAEAVLGGFGVGLLDASIFARQLREGELVQLGAEVHTGWNHYLVTSECAPSSAPREAFREWVMLEPEGARPGSQERMKSACRQRASTTREGSDFLNQHPN